VVVYDPIASALFDEVGAPLLQAGDTIELEGDVEMVGWKKDGKDMPPYRQITARTITRGGDRWAA
jgi:hypothetical protein